MSPVPHLFKIRGVLRWSWKPNVTSVKRTSSNEFGIPIGITGTLRWALLLFHTAHSHGQTKEKEMKFKSAYFFYYFSKNSQVGTFHCIWTWLPFSLNWYLTKIILLTCQIIPNLSSEVWILCHRLSVCLNTKSFYVTSLISALAISLLSVAFNF